MKGFNSKEVAFDNRYIIFDDGKVYSKISQKFLKPVKIHDGKKTTKPHYTYTINGKRYYISRLLVFHFAEHKFKSIDDLPTVYFLNNNTEDFDIDNLIF